MKTILYVVRAWTPMVGSRWMGLDRINQQVADTTTRLENLQRLHENLPELFTPFERVERAEKGFPGISLRSMSAYRPHFK